MDFGKNLQGFRKLKKMTQQDLSDLTGYDKRMISRWESGNTKPNIEAVINIAKTLDVSLDVLAGLNDDKGTETHYNDPELDFLVRCVEKLPKKDINTVKALLKLITAGAGKTE
jgi:transcriptional regulator with XRE-family HTH domain